MLPKNWFNGLKINEVMGQGNGLILACNDGTVFNARSFECAVNPKLLRKMEIKRTAVGGKGLQISLSNKANFLITEGHIVTRDGRTFDINDSPASGLRERGIFLQDGV